MPTVIDASLSHWFDACRQASHLPPDRLPTLTPSMAAKVFVTTKENSHWLVSRLGADRGQSSGRLRIEGERALAFAAEFDPQPFCRSVRRADRFLIHRPSRSSEIILEGSPRNPKK